MPFFKIPVPNLGALKRTLPTHPIWVLFLIVGVAAAGCNRNSQEAQNGSNGTGALPKNIIFLIGDGMGVAQVTAGMVANGGQLHLERCTHSGFCKTWSANNLITDSAAGATAFSCGIKTYNGAVGVDVDTTAVKTVLEIAEEKGLATGLVATCEVTHATPASFIAHQSSRYLMEHIALDYLQTDVNVVIGGGRSYFNNRSDSLNLLDSLRDKAYKIVTDQSELSQVPSGKMYALLADSSMPRMSEGRGDYLKTATLTAIGLLDQDPDGFFLMVEGSQIDWGGHAHDYSYVIDEMLDFDQAVGAALDFAEQDGNTLVVITSDHETGGLAVTGGNLEKKTVTGHFTADLETCNTDHTAEMVPVFAFGPGADQFMGILDNTDFFHKFLQLLKLDGGEGA